MVEKRVDGGVEILLIPGVPAAAVLSVLVSANSTFPRIWRKPRSWSSLLAPRGGSELDKQRS